MASRLLRHARANAVAYVALFVALGGTALAATPQLQFQFSFPDFLAASGDLRGHYPNPVIAPDAVNGAKTANNSLTGADVDESTLGTVPDAAKLGGLGPSSFLKTTDTAGGDLGGPFSNLQVKPNALTGADVNESTLAQVPSAADADKLGGTPASSYLTAGSTLNPARLSALPHVIATGPAQTFRTQMGDVVAFDTLSNSTGGFSIGSFGVTVPVTGLYLVSATIDWSSNATGLRLLKVGAVGGSVGATDTRDAVTGGDTLQSVSGVVVLQEHQPSFVFAQQESGGDLATRSQGPTNPAAQVSLVWLGPA